MICFHNYTVDCVIKNEKSHYICIVVLSKEVWTLLGPIDSMISLHCNVEHLTCIFTCTLHTWMISIYRNI